MRGLLGCLGVLVAAAFAVGVSPDKARADVDCSAFSTQAQAQSFFLNHGGPSSDPDGLDADHDGVACESNPCPCSTGSGGGGGGGGGHPGHKPGHKPHHKHKKKHRKPLERAPILGQPVYLPTQCSDGAIAPPAVLLDCGEGAVSLKDTTWSRFDETEGDGTGTMMYPGCGSTMCPSFAEAPASVMAYRPKYCRNVGRNSFTRMWVYSPTAINPYAQSYGVEFGCSLLH